MKYANQLWQNLSDNEVFIKNDWQIWLAIGVNGQMIENENDEVLYRHKKLNKAISITYELNGNFEFEYFFSDFNHYEIDILNF